MSSSASSASRPTKRAKKLPTSTTKNKSSSKSRKIDDLTALTTAQLFSLSTRRHRDQTRDTLRRAQIERDLAHTALQQCQLRLEQSNKYLEEVAETARDAQREYLDAKTLLERVRSVSNSTLPPINLALDEDDDDDDSTMADLTRLLSTKPKSSSTAKTATAATGVGGGTPKQKFPHISEILLNLALSNQLHNSSEPLTATPCHLIPKTHNSQYTHTMQLISEVWTEEEELFLRSPKHEIEENIEEARIICEGIGYRCLEKLNEWEGRSDVRPTNHQKASFVSVGVRARRVFVGRKKAEENAV